MVYKLYLGDSMLVFDDISMTESVLAKKKNTFSYQIIYELEMMEKSLLSILILICIFMIFHQGFFWSKCKYLSIIFFKSGMMIT